MGETGESAGGACASCGGPGDDLQEVRRVYLAVDGDNRVTGTQTVDEPEWWCLSCRTLYPHIPEGPGSGHRTPDPGRS